jgi:CsoR family transcriptional regulator, copper-sensing transcriptional repressor
MAKHEQHEHPHEHPHVHTHQNTKAVINRLARASGHLESVKRMVEDGKDCSDVLIQLSAVIAALNNTGKVILKDHIAHCIVDAVETGDQSAIENLNKAIDGLIK